MKHDSTWCYKLEKECEKWLAETIGGGDAIHAEALAKFVHLQICKMDGDITHKEVKS